MCQCIRPSLLIVVCLYLPMAGPLVGWARGDEQAGKSENGSAASAHLAKLQKLSLQRLFEAYASAKYGAFASRNRNYLPKDVVLTEIIRRGGAECEEFLKKKFEAATKQSNGPFPTPNLELLTALRRIHKKPDPVFVDVAIPKDLEATTRNLPTFGVALKNVDEEKTAVVIAFGGNYRTGRLARWRFEVRDSRGKLLPQRDWEATRGGGMFMVRGLDYGKTWTASLPMGNYIKITQPGEYTVRILYHDRQTIADLDDVDGLIMCSSKPFKLKVARAVPKVVTVPPGSRKRALALVAALPDDGPIRVVMGTYGPAFHKFMDPKSPQGQLHTMGCDALPGLLEALRDEKLSYRRRGWVLAMLYVFTGERDLNPLSWTKWHGVLPACEYRGLGCEGSISGGTPSRKEQRELTDQWLKLQAECWDFREAKR
jgi:hypothetical protein